VGSGQAVTCGHPISSSQPVEVATAAPSRTPRVRQRQHRHIYPDRDEFLSSGSAEAEGQMRYVGHGLPTITSVRRPARGRSSRAPRRSLVTLSWPCRASSGFEPFYVRSRYECGAGLGDHGTSHRLRAAQCQPRLASNGPQKSSYAAAAITVKWLATSRQSCAFLRSDDVEWGGPMRTWDAGGRMSPIRYAGAWKHAFVQIRSQVR
jgi:hypothetical protein